MYILLSELELLFAKILSHEIDVIASENNLTLILASQALKIRSVDYKR